MTGERRVDRLREDVGELLVRHERGRDLEDFGRYADDPVGFIRDVLGGDPWERQVEIAEAVRDHPQVTVRSCHAAGKDWLAARLALWWVYARRGLVVLTGPTAAQVEEILMRHEVRAAFLAGDLPGELHVRALRPRGRGEAGILARTARDTHSLTGLHRRQVLFIMTEAQDPEIDHAWDAAFAVCTGAEDRKLMLGNPTEPGTRFHRSHESPDWRAVKIAAEDIPNVREGRTVVPGLLSREGVARFAREYGEESPVYRARVLAEFPATAVDSLLRPEWRDRSTDLWRSEKILRQHEDVTLGVDPARLGPDRSVVCIRRGLHVLEFIPWRNHDTMATAHRVEGIVRRYLEKMNTDTLGQVGPVRTVAVDSIGLGSGVLDRLRETLPNHEFWETPGRVHASLRPGHPRALSFDAGARAPQPDRFVNARAQAFWRLRRLLEEGRLALPPRDDLWEELFALRVSFGADGRTVIESKDDIKARLGRSPDLADALCISLAGELAGAGRKLGAFR